MVDRELFLLLALEYFLVFVENEHIFEQGLVGCFELEPFFLQHNSHTSLSFVGCRQFTHLP